MSPRTDLGRRSLLAVKPNTETVLRGSRFQIINVFTMLV
jgi:hypothetical protein